MLPEESFDEVEGNPVCLFLWDGERRFRL